MSTLIFYFLSISSSFKQLVFQLSKVYRAKVKAQLSQLALLALFHGNKADRQMTDHHDNNHLYNYLLFILSSCCFKQSKHSFHFLNSKVYFFNIVIIRGPLKAPTVMFILESLYSIMVKCMGNGGQVLILALSLTSYAILGKLYRRGQIYPLHRLWWGVNKIPQTKQSYMTYKWHHDCWCYSTLLIQPLDSLIDLYL